MDDANLFEENEVKKIPEESEIVTPDTTKKKVIPKIFFDFKKNIEISVYGYHNKETGEYAFAIPAESVESTNPSLEEVFMKVEYKFWFTRCSYDRLNRYRRSATTYTTNDPNGTINPIKMHEMFLIGHLVDWNLTDENGDKIKLTFNSNGMLSDDSLNLVYTLPSALLDIVLNTYERKMAIVL